MHVLFVAPNFPANQREFVRALHAVGARVTGIGDTPVEYLDGELKGWLHGYEHVRSLADEDALYAAVRRVQSREWVDRLECTVEVHMLPAARVRERCSIPGLSAEQVNLCRDKFVMKRFLREKGIPCAQNAAIETADEARRFIAETGYPVILKPRDGAGAHDTFKIENGAQLEDAIRKTGIDRNRRSVTMEEFYSGHEGFYDTLTCNGEVVFEAVCHYYPNVLEAMRTREVNPYVVVTNRVDAEGYTELRLFGRRVIKALGLTTTPTHMEWFFGNRGLWFSEIGARPPGVRFWDLYCWANDMDLYVDWARAICFGESHPKPSRKYSAGLISIRPNRDGTIVGFRGIEEAQRRYGQWIGNVHLPQVGSRTPDIGSGYMGHAWMHVRHPDYDELRRMLDHIGQMTQVLAE